MSQQHQMAMQGMSVGGPVGAPANAGTPTNSATPYSPQDIIKKLNTAIYDYLLCNEKYDAARAIKDCLPIEQKDPMKQSPSQRQNQPNGVDSNTDGDSKDHIGIRQRPEGLPAPITLSNEEGPFLQDWWCQFWELYQGNRQRGKQATLSYVGHQRTLQKGRTGMMAGVDPNAAQRGYSMMNNGNLGDLRQAALKNGMSPAQQHQLAQQLKMRSGQGAQMQGAQMERQGSQMDMNGPRSGSPNTGGDAPSPKRQRLDGGNLQQMSQARPGQSGQMPAGGNQSVEVYSAAIKQQMHQAMARTNSDTSKGMPPNPAMGPGGPQSSPMNQQGLEVASGDFYPNRMVGMPQNGTVVAATPGQQGNNGGNHALQDYQMQLMLLEQQNKKRLLMARQEQDSMVHPSGAPGPNGGQFAPGMSPQGSRAGDPSPNPSDMQRGMMDPSAVTPAMRQQMMMGPNGQLRPPSSHPMGQISQQQMEMMQRSGQMMSNGNWPGGPQPPQGHMMQQAPQQGGPLGQQPNMTPRQGNMPPPPAPGANTGGTQPSSPATQPAPPTPNQTHKAKPSSKKAADKKGAANKKSAPAATNDDSNAPPTPTPPPPVTPSNAQAFSQNKGMQMPNGQPGPGQHNSNGNNAQQPTAPAVQQSVSETNPPFGDLNGTDQFSNMDFPDLVSGDGFDSLDFDIFLHTGDDPGLGGFDANFAFGDADGIPMD